MACLVGFKCMSKLGCDHYCHHVFDWCSETGPSITSLAISYLLFSQQALTWRTRVYTWSNSTVQCTSKTWIRLCLAFSQSNGYGCPWRETSSTKQELQLKTIIEQPITVQLYDHVVASRCMVSTRISFSTWMASNYFTIGTYMYIVQQC